MEMRMSCYNYKHHLSITIVIRELQYAFNIFATRQPPTFATHTQNWNDNILVSSYWMDCEREPLPYAAG
jgi:hypothetical protein